ncbi:hypothetical protein, partial [Streptomyces sp. NPDC005143]
MLVLSAADVRLPVDANYRHDGEVRQPGNTGCRDQRRLLVVGVVGPRPDPSDLFDAARLAPGQVDTEL